MKLTKLKIYSKFALKTFRSIHSKSSMSNLVVKKLQIRKAARPNLVTPLTSVKVPTNGDSVSKSLGLVLDEARKKRFPMA